VAAVAFDAAFLSLIVIVHGRKCAKAVIALRQTGV
jgi:hypothetical protein